MRQLLNKFRDREEFGRAFWAGLFAFCALSTFASFYGFAWDGQEERCLPWRLMFLYPVGSEQVARGDYVQFVAVSPNFFGKFNGGSAGKMVAGIPGDQIEINSGHASINGSPIPDLEQRAATKLGRPMASFDARYTLGHDEYFMVGTMPHSFDSRYWGPIKRSQIRKRLIGIL